MSIGNRSLYKNVSRKENMETQ